MNRKKFNIVASVSAFALGAIFIFSDGASISANVIGSSGIGAAFASIIGIFMIIGSMILFEVSMNHADTQEIDLERLIRRTKDHEEIYNSKNAEKNVQTEEPVPQHVHHGHVVHHNHEKNDE